MVGTREPDTRPSEDDAVGWTVVRLAHVLSRQFEAAMQAVSLTATQFGVLASIAAEPGLGSGQLARRVLVTPQSVGELVAALEAAGLVTRDRSGGRGRRAGISLTPRGEQILGQAYRIVAALNEPSRLGLDAAEVVTLNTLLHRVLRTVQTGQPDTAG
jgi:DNA-binding MarR family transcriptional regulator